MFFFNYFEPEYPACIFAFHEQILTSIFGFLVKSQAILTHKIPYNVMDKYLNDLTRGILDKLAQCVFKILHDDLKTSCLKNL